jgi:CRISPR-associated endoribonuclease Cas6/Csy4 subtype I-F
MDKYLDIIIPDGNDLQAMGYSKLLGAVHGINKAAHAGLVVSFPRWVEPLFVKGEMLSRGALGCVLRVFGSQDSLNLLLQRTELTSAAAARIIYVNEIQDTPAHSQWVSFRRDRSGDKVGPSHMRRLARRLAARGEAVPLSDAISKLKGGKVPYLTIEAYSHSTDSRFGLRIKRILTTPEVGATGRFDSYGLALEGAAVPSF